MDHEERKAYLDERKLLVETERDTAKTFDTSLITLISGALAISLVFMKEIAPTPHSISLLVASWVSFVLALLLIMASFLTSQKATRKQRDILDALQADASANQVNREANWTNLLNWSAIITFIFGVVFLVCFAATNVESRTKGENMSRQNNSPTDHRGFIPPQSPVFNPDAGVVPPKAPLLPTAPPAPLTPPAK